MESDGASRCVSCSSSDADFPRGFTPCNTHCSASIIRGVAEIACACASACDIGSSYLSVAFLLYYKVIYLSIIIIILLPAAIAKAGIIFKVSMCVNQMALETSCSVDYHTVASILAGVCVFVSLNQRNLVRTIALQPLEVQNETWQACSCDRNAGRL